MGLRVVLPGTLDDLQDMKKKFFLSLGALAFSSVILREELTSLKL